MKNLCVVLEALFFLTLCSFTASATHLRGGVIYVDRVSGLVYEITIVGYHESSSTVPFGGGVLSFGDGSEVQGSDLTWNTVASTADYATVQAKVTHQYPAPGIYTIGYSETTRSEVLNISNSSAREFYVETTIETWISNRTPRLPYENLMTVFEAGKVGIRDLHVTDVDGDRVKYTLTTPKQGKSQYVSNYHFPDHEEFYSSYRNYTGNGDPVFSLDKATGTLMWDVPGDAGQDHHHRAYTLAIKIEEYREIAGEEVKISTTIADIDLKVVDELSGGLMVLIEEDNFCFSDGGNQTLFEVRSEVPYQVRVAPSASVKAINGTTSDQMLDSTFTESASFDLSFQSFEEEQFVTVAVQSAKDAISFTYLLSSECEAYILSTDAEIKEKPFILYPNPAQEEIHIRDVGEQLSYKVIGLGGKVAGQGTVRDGKISLQNVENGIYIFQLLDTRTNQISTQKLVVRK